MFRPVAAIAALLAVLIVAGGAGATDVDRRGSTSVPNGCRNTASANNSEINVTTSGTASPKPAVPGDPITLTDLQQQGAIPGAIFVAGYNLLLLQQGQNTVYGTARTKIEGVNTVEGVLETNTANIEVSTTITDPDGEPGTGDETATDGSFTADYDDLTFTAGPSGEASFRQDTQPVAPTGANPTTAGSLIIVARPGGDPPPATNGLQVRFNCSPAEVEPPDPGTVTPIDPAPAFASTDPDVAEPTPSPSPEPTASPAPTQTASPAPSASPSPSPAPSASPTPSPEPTFCVVPKLKGKKLAKAKAAIRKTDCRVGPVVKVKVKKKKRKALKGKVLGSFPAAGAKRAPGIKVYLTVGK